MIRAAIPMRIPMSGMMMAMMPRTRLVMANALVLFDSMITSENS